MERETLFSENPAEVAQHWEALGASMLHIVDLDGAVGGKPHNEDAINQILKAVTIPLQLGGGIRSLKTIEHYLTLGLKRIVLGTVAQKRPELVEEACKQFSNRIVVGIDARDGRVAVEGWTETTSRKALDLAKDFEEKGVAAIVFTDINRDGMMGGPNVESTRELAEATRIPIIASGGVTTLEHIRKLLTIEASGIEGVIIGRALYEKTIDLKEALKLVSTNSKH
jgi:phosphoribosylformimino-5-aminoimidazole carboxamide ribotide isomerase